MIYQYIQWKWWFEEVYAAGSNSNQTENFYLKSEQSLQTFIKLSMPISILPLEDQFQLGKMKQFQVVKDIL